MCLVSANSSDEPSVSMKRLTHEESKSSDHSSLSQTDDSFSPYARLKTENPYDKLRGKCLSIFIVLINGLHLFNYNKLGYSTMKLNAHRSGSDGSMSASGSTGAGFDPRRGGKFSTSELGGMEMYTY